MQVAPPSHFGMFKVIKAIFFNLLIITSLQLTGGFLTVSYAQTVTCPDDGRITFSLEAEVCNDVYSTYSNSQNGFVLEYSGPGTFIIQLRKNGALAADSAFTITSGSWTNYGNGHSKTCNNSTSDCNFSFSDETENGDRYTFSATLLTGSTEAVNASVIITRASVQGNVSPSATAAANLSVARTSLIIGNRPNFSGLMQGAQSAGSGTIGTLALNGAEAGQNIFFMTSLNRIRIGMANREQNQIDHQTPSQVSSKLALVPLSQHTTRREAFSPLLSMTTREPNAKPTAIAIGLSDTPSSSGQVQPEPEPFTGVPYGADYDVWIRLSGNRGKNGDASSNFWIGHVGGHVFLNPDLIVGGLLQLDWVSTSDSSIGQQGRGGGWMIGPYAAARFFDQRLYLDFNASWGQGSNDVGPIGTNEENNFDSYRWLVAGKLSGPIDYQNWRFTPEIGVSYFREEADGFFDSAGTHIAGQTAAQGEVLFGPYVRYTYRLDEETFLLPSLGITGRWNFGVENPSSIASPVLESGDIRARVDGGLTGVFRRGVSLDVKGYYDGFGVANFYNYGGDLRLNVPF
ncbi:autotransporter outer membrane beta-barrel domain-containing protein [Pseudovibrio denitrificans]|uniref:autotransporter outer membrane beta-barrel domain-containing protein n=1 Tax=Pseudovibrio denitrificans TaxID=258256 RepID=UPI0039BEDDC0